MVYGTHMLLKIIIILPGFVKQHVRFIKLFFRLHEETQKLEKSKVKSIWINPFNFIIFGCNR
jgi:hypothetical protein